MKHLILTTPYYNNPWVYGLKSILEGLGQAQPDYTIRNGEELDLTQRLKNFNQDVYEALSLKWYHPGNIDLQASNLTIPQKMKFRQRTLGANINSRSLWVCDDPAMCILLPIWRECLDNAFYVVLVSDPVETAFALQEKWRFPVVFGIALWEYYTRSALINTQDYHRLVISQHDLLHSTSETLEKIHKQLKNRGVPPEIENIRLSEQVILERILSAKKNEQAFRLKDDFMSSAQVEFYESLLDGSMDIPDLQMMSETGKDILNYYGRLRAGFEMIKERSSPVLTQSNEYPDGKEINVDCSDAGSEYINASIYFQDIDCLELSFGKDDPMLRTLIASLGHQHRKKLSDDLLYLTWQEGALYFPSSQVIGIETDQHVQHEYKYETTAAEVDTVTKKSTAKDNIIAKKKKTVAILVLGCLLPQYQRAIKTIQDTWGKVSGEGIDVYYMFGAHIDPRTMSEDAIETYIKQKPPALFSFEAKQFENIILCGCADGIQIQPDCILRKRLIAFDYITDNFDYDYIYTVCASSYVDQPSLRTYIDTIQSETIFHGPTGVCQFTGLPYVSGASMLLSRDLAKLLATNKNQIINDNQSQCADDVAISTWIAQHISDVSVSEIVKNVKQGKKATNDDTFVVPYARPMVDFFNINISDQHRQNDLYHYHFNINKMEQMYRFHTKFT